MATTRASYKPAAKKTVVRKTVPARSVSAVAGTGAGSDQLPASRPRRVVGDDPIAAVSRGLANVQAQADTSADEPQVEVTVPKAFYLTDDNHERHHYPAGTKRMPESHAGHWYAVANGVTID